MNFIEELFYGNINPNLKRSYKNPQYSNAMTRFCESEVKLRKMLKGKELKLYNKLIDANLEIMSIQEIENFKIGFSLGAQMMMDIFSTDNEKLFIDAFSVK